MARGWAHLLEEAPAGGPTTSERLRGERVLFGLSFLLAAAACGLLLGEGHPFSVLAPAALLLLCVSMRITVQRTSTSWTSCEQAALVLVAFTLPLNLLPLAMLACGLTALSRRPRPALTLLTTACNSWAAVILAVLLAALAPGRAEWVHWPAYLAAFGSQILGAVLIFAARDRFRNRPLELEDAISAVAVDASLTPIGIAAAVELYRAPGATMAVMVGATALLALTHHEHEQRIIQTERALRDPLTGLANRALFEEAGSACESRCRRNAQRAALVLVDLDDFKLVNDSFGHKAGDEVLSAFGERMRRATRAADLAARVGGDEFALILAEPIELDAARRVAEQLREELYEPIELTSGQIIRVRASFGVALFGPATSLAAATVQADAALYDEKLVAHAQRAGSARSITAPAAAPEGSASASSLEP